jgi:hypothetical protein
MDIIRTIAKTAVAVKQLVPPEHILVDVLDPDWDGTPRILINCEETRPEDVSLLTVMTETTVVYISVLSDNRDEAWLLGSAAGQAVGQYFDACALQGEYGIYSVDLLEKQTNHIPERNTYRSNYVFNILHKPLT